MWHWRSFFHRREHARFVIYGRKRRDRVRSGNSELRHTMLSFGCDSAQAELCSPCGDPPTCLQLDAGLCSPLSGYTPLFDCRANLCVCAPLQALILTPTREIALQVAAVLRALAAEVPDAVVGTLIGGLPIEDDQQLLRRSGVRAHVQGLADLGLARTSMLSHPVS